MGYNTLQILFLFIGFHKILATYCPQNLKKPCLNSKHCCLQEPVCHHGSWTPWFNNDKPTGTGDYEILDDIRKKNSELCCEKPKGMHVALKDGRHFTFGEDKLIFLPNSRGMKCVKASQGDGECKDYKIRFCCPKKIIPAPVPSCSGVWTKWFDRDNPSATGDWETLSSIRKENPSFICEHPSAVHATLTDGRPHEYGEDKIHLSKKEGLICKNKEQRDGKCQDYRVRFCCPKIVPAPVPSCSGEWTTWFDRDNPSVTGDWETLSSIRKENPSLCCEHPSAVHATLTDGRPYEYGRNKIHLSKKEGLICKNAEQNGGHCADYRVRFCCPKKCYWSQWFDRDNPSGTGDYETLVNIRKENPGKVCSHPQKLEVGFVKKYGGGHDVFAVKSAAKGLVCKNKEQPYGSRGCSDYKVRFYCC